MKRRTKAHVRLSAAIQAARRGLAGGALTVSDLARETGYEPSTIKQYLAEYPSVTHGEAGAKRLAIRLEAALAALNGAPK